MRYDLSGPGGNAFAVMGLIRSICFQVEPDRAKAREQAEKILEEAKNTHSYIGILETIDKHFPSLIEWEHDPRKEAEFDEDEEGEV